MARAGKPQLETGALPSPLLTVLLQEHCQYYEVYSELSHNDGCGPLFISHETAGCIWYTITENNHRMKYYKLLDTTVIGSSLTKKGINSYKVSA